MSEEGVKVGRPLGSTGVPEVREVVQEWKPIHDQVVMLHLARYSHKEIAEVVGFTPEYVGQLLRTPQATQLIEDARQRFKESMVVDIETEMLELAKKSLKNLRKTIEKDIPVHHPAKRHQDNIGIKMLQSLGYGTGSGPAKADKGTASEETLQRLTRALEKSNEGRGIVIDAEIIEDPAA